jgi:hypothetical protein
MFSMQATPIGMKMFCSIKISWGYVYVYSVYESKGLQNSPYGKWRPRTGFSRLVFDAVSMALKFEDSLECIQKYIMVSTIIYIDMHKSKSTSNNSDP